MMRAISSNTRRSSSSAPSAVRISITWRKVRALAVHRMSVERPIGASLRKRGGDLLLDVKWHTLLVDAELLGSAHLELLELLDDAQDLLAHGLQGRRYTKADVRETHIAQALLAEGRAGSVADELVGEHTAHVAQSERPVGVLHHAAVGAAQDVGEVLALVGAHLRDVRIQPRLPAAVASPAAELDDQLTAVGRARRPLEAALQPRLAANIAPGSRACPRRRSRVGRSERRWEWSRA